MRSRVCCSVVALLGAAALAAQPAGTHVVSVEPGPAVAVRRGAEIDVPLKLAIRSGYHVNSNQPADDYLIPTALNWTPSPLTVRRVTYPKAESVKYDFSEKPLLVYSGAFTVTSRFAAAPEAPRGPLTLSGKLRYQACTDKVCLAPRTLDVSLALTVE